MIIYTTGTVSINTGDTTVVGVGTNWTTSGIQPYWYMSFDSILWYPVLEIVDDTHIELSLNYIGGNLSDATYIVVDKVVKVTLDSIKNFIFGDLPTTEPSSPKVVWSDNGGISITH